MANIYVCSISVQRYADPNWHQSHPVSQQIRPMKIIKKAEEKQALQPKATTATPSTVAGVAARIISLLTRPTTLSPLRSIPAPVPKKAQTAKAATIAAPPKPHVVPKPPAPDPAPASAPAHAAPSATSSNLSISTAATPSFQPDISPCPTVIPVVAAAEAELKEQENSHKRARSPTEVMDDSLLFKRAMPEHQSPDILEQMQEFAKFQFQGAGSEMYMHMLRRISH